VILAVSALNRSHKRVDHIIEEASQVSGDVLLWLDGRVEDPSLEKMAHEKLGPRCRITHLPSAQIPELYHLADIFVHGALEEGFGLAICEAASAGLMVLVHDSPHFRWLVGARSCLVDMSVAGPLSERLRVLSCSPRPIASLGRQLADGIRSRFDWQVVGPQYMDMYRKVAAA
jgi:glycosyltransferase involved in cell wall biosynthesis